MKSYSFYNKLFGWVAFFIAAIVYILTIEPTASFWDCGEFIASAFKLEVGHPPGAPFFLILGRFFAIFAPDVSKVAMMINALSALASAFTILFLFWTITHLARKLVIKNGDEPSLAQTVAILGSGLVGSLAYTFSDTFWFSAVEGEVYGLSSLFTAIVFWAILKWENEANSPHSNRWLVFIAYMMGLSIGVHLLNLLAIPAIVLVYYFKKYPVTRWGVLAALAISVVILGSIMYVIIPGIVTVASWFELLFVNGFGLPFKSGVIFYGIILVSLIVWGLHFTYKKQKVIFHSILLMATVIVIGYSSYAVIVIRSLANPPMNENEPSSVFALLHYLNREQYGDRPLVTGHYFNAPVIESNDVHTYIKKNGKYVKSYLKPSYKLDDRFKTVFPRMWSARQEHVTEYKKWSNYKGRPIRITNSMGEQEVRYVPTFGENLRFFFSYQVGHMYWRYFMWNFAGRQNDVQSHGEIQNGNWISGIKFIDEIMLGNQSKLTPDMLNHPARNTYYLLPFILGIIGLIYQLTRDQKNFWVVTLLFILTGIAIVVYLNQHPLQPRERDYAYAGSFYAFSIWIGLGVMAFFDVLSKKGNKVFGAAFAVILTATVPALMASENWDDHDRSGRYVARDFAYNYLNTCEPNAIVFTNGDNDTFPLWYAQEVEGIRTDVRVVNLSLLGTDWYISQMKRKAYESEPIKISMEFDQYVQGTRDIIYIMDRVSKPVELKQIMDFVASDRVETRYRTPGGELIDYLPSKNLKISINKDDILSKGVVEAKDAHKIVDTMQWTLGKEYLQKNEMMVLEIIANNNWERPIYFVSTGGESDLGLSKYLRYDGFAYKLVPIEYQSDDFLAIGGIDADLLYTNLMENFKWGRMNEPDVLIDHNIQRTAMVLRIRNTYSRLAEELLKQNRKDSAVKVIDKVVELMPNSKFPYDFLVLGHIDSYYKANETEKANVLLKDYATFTIDNLKYYFSLQGNFANVVSYDKELNLQVLQELVSLAENYGQTELYAEIEPILNDYFMQYIKMQQ